MCLAIKNPLVGEGGEAYGDEDEVFYCPKVILTGLRIMVLAVLHFAFPYLEKHRLVVQDLIA